MTVGEGTFFIRLLHHVGHIDPWLLIEQRQKALAAKADQNFHWPPMSEVPFCTGSIDIVLVIIILNISISHLIYSKIPMLRPPLELSKSF